MTSDAIGKRKLQPAPYRCVSALNCYLAYASALLVGIVAWSVLQSQQFLGNPLWTAPAVSCAGAVLAQLTPGMHLFPTALVYFAFAPAALVLLSDPISQPVFGLWDIVGMAGTLSAVVIQLAADKQLRKYRASCDCRRGGTLRRGLWKYSRHPNYFGEVRCEE